MRRMGIGVFLLALLVWAVAAEPRDTMDDVLARLRRSGL